MELWIRSQDKKQLIKCESIVAINNWIKVNDKFDVGYFETLKNGEQRALEVLEEIQDLMRSLSDSDLKIIQYEMPKE